MKRRLTIAVATAVILLSVLRCSAAGAFTCKYTPKTATGTVFYVDVYSEIAVSAAVFELSFDSKMAEYRSAAAVSASSTVRDSVDGGTVRLALADSSAVDGHVCRLSFKALAAGETSFTLHINQAADKDLDYISGLSNYTLTIQLGENDVTSPGGKASVVRSSSAYSYKSGGKSTVSANPADEKSVAYGEVYDLRPDKTFLYIFIGAGSVLLLAGLIFAGYLAGRRGKNKSSDENKNLPENGETDEINMNIEE